MYDETRKPPEDRFNYVYIVLLLLGIGTVLPWNMFITADSYFVEYKLNVTDSTPQLDTYRNNFLSYLSIFAIGPNFLLQLVNLVYQTGCGTLRSRISVSVVVQKVAFVLTIILAILDTSSWPIPFFFLTMATVVVLNMAGGVYQNSAYGVSANLPMAYTNAIVVGMNLSGTFCALVRIMSLAVAPDARIAAIYYFSTALVYLVVLLVVYWTLYKNPYYIHFNKKLDEEEEQLAGKSGSQPKARSMSGSKHSKEAKLAMFIRVFKECWIQCINVFLVFFVSLSVFPAVQANITSVDGLFGHDYFAPVTTFLTFNLFAMIGNIVCASDWIPKMGPKYLWIPIVARLLFIPLFLFCNYTPSTREWPVFIKSDYAFWALGILLGFTSGYFSSLGLMYAPKLVKKSEDAEIAGMMAAFFLISGILAGVSFSFFLSYIVTV